MVLARVHQIKNMRGPAGHCSGARHKAVIYGEATRQRPAPVRFIFLSGFSKSVNYCFSKTSVTLVFVPSALLTVSVTVRVLPSAE